MRPPLAPVGHCGFKTLFAPVCGVEPTLHGLVVKGRVQWMVEACDDHLAVLAARCYDVHPYERGVCGTTGSVWVVSADEVGHCRRPTMDDWAVTTHADQDARSHAGAAA